MKKSSTILSMTLSLVVFAGCGGSDTQAKTTPKANSAPVAISQSVTTDKDSTKAITLAGTDADGDTLTYAVVTAPTHGTFVNGVYTPKANYNGSDSFTFKANDGKVDSAPATVSIMIAMIAVSEKHTCKPLPKTGQTTVYANYDDGHYQKGASADPRFVRDDTTQTVKDNATGLVWQDDAEVKTTKRNWQDAVEYCEALELGVFKDWRLPTMKELVYIIDKGRSDPAIDPEFENISSSHYWSSITNARDASYAWYVGFLYGIDYGDFKSDVRYVRCVRDGQ